MKFPFHSHLHGLAFCGQILRKECGDLNEVASDNGDDNKVVEIGTCEALLMCDSLVNLKYLSKEKRISLVAMKDRLEKSAEQKTKPY